MKKREKQSLLKWMKENRWTAKAAAEHIKCSPVMLRNILYGHVMPKLDLAFRIEKWTKGEIDAEDLIPLCQPIIDEETEPCDDNS